MEQLIYYLLEVNVLLVILYGAFWLIAGKETFHQLNRMLLLCILVGAFTLPLLSFPEIPVQLPAWVDFSEAAEEVSTAPAGGGADMMRVEWTNMSGKEVSGQTVSENEWQRFSVARVLFYFYLIVTSVFLLRFFFQFFSLYRLIQSGKHYWDEGLIQVHVTEDISPFSFFHWVFFNPEQVQGAAREMILEHERVHAEQYHNLDILLAGLCTVFLWFNPLVWKLRQVISQNLEYIADERMLRKGVNRKQYQYSLLSLSAPLVRLSIANHFNYSLIKNRIHMMNIKKSPDHRLIRYLLFVPLVLSFLLISNLTYAQSKTKEKPKKEVKEKPEAKPEKDALIKVKPKAKTEKADILEIKPDAKVKTTQTEAIEESPSAKATSAVTVEGVAVVEGSNTSVAVAQNVSPESVVVGEVATAQSIGTSVVVTGKAVDIVEGVEVTDEAEAVVVGNLRFSESLGVGTPDFNIPVKEDENVFLVIRSDVDQQMLDEINEILRKRGIYARFSDIQFDAEGRLTSIYVGVKVGDQYQGQMRGYNGGRPLEEPIVMYVMKDGTDSFGISTGLPQDLPAKMQSSLSRLTGLWITQGEDNFIKGILKGEFDKKGAY